MNRNFLIFFPVYSIIFFFVYFYHREGVLDNTPLGYVSTVSGEWKRGYCIYGNVLEREYKDENVISLILHASQDRVDGRIAEQVKNWNSSVSLAVVLDDGALDPVSCFFRKLLPIWSKVKFLLSVHLLIPHQSTDCPTLEFTKNQAFPCHSTPTVSRLDISKITSYPVNLARNAARSFVTSRFILIADLDHFFSKSFEAKMRALAEDFYQDENNHKTVLVYRIFEVADGYYKGFDPLTKKRLKSLLRNKKAREFHSSFGNGHQIPFLKEWLEEDSEGIQFYKDYTSSNWEPQFVSLPFIPFHDESFLYPRKDNTVLRWEMCRSNFTFTIVFNHFMYHRGFKSFKTHRLLDRARAKIQKETRSAFLEFDQRMDFLYPKTKKSCPNPRI